MPIYFIGNGNGQVKIGYSKDPVARLLTLQTGSPYPLELLAVRPGEQATEAELHAKFADNRLEGEWFQLVQKLEIEISVIQQVYPLESYLHQSDSDRRIWEDAVREYHLAIDKLHDEYDLKIDKLEREIERLEAEQDENEKELNQILQVKIEGIHPWWLELEDM